MKLLSKIKMALIYNIKTYLGIRERKLDSDSLTEMKN
jgi:hypothetical protein